MDNPAECKVCFTCFSTKGEHRPRAFPCGHTFCSSCITSLLGKGGGCLTCPTCRVQHAASSSTHFPVNYSMEALIQQMQALVEQREVPETVKEPQEGDEEISGALSVEMKELKQAVMNHLVDCCTIKTQLQQHQEQRIKPQVAQHMTLLTRLCDLVADNKTAMTQVMESQEKYSSLVDEGQAITCHLQTVVDHLESAVWTHEGKTAIILAKTTVQEMKRWKERYEEMSADDQALAASTQILEATQRTLKQLTAEEIGERRAPTNPVTTSQLSAILERAQHYLQHFPAHSSTLTTEDLRLLRTEVRKLLEARQVFGVHQDEAGCLYSSKLTLENGSLHLYHLLDRSPPYNAHTVQVTGYLSTPHPVLLAFLDLTWRGQVKGRVYIRLHLDLPLARQFLLLCSGKQGHSYAGTSLLKVCGLDNQGEFIMGGDYSCNDGSGGPPLLPDLQGNYKKTGAAGSVWGRWEVEDHRSAQFAITTRDCRGSIPRVFGSVEEGMGLVRAAVVAMKTWRVTVDECGVVLSL